MEPIQCRSSVRKPVIGALVVLTLLACSSSLVYARNSLKSIAQQYKIERDPLYLPSVDKVRLVTLGFDSFASHILWFNTLNYFGKQFAAKADYQWLGHMCTLVTDLDPQNRQVTEFCATMLSWVANQPESSSAILRKAIASNPEYWRFHYLLGFNYWYFHDKKELAKESLEQAALLPEAPYFLSSLAARLSAEISDPGVAHQFLQEAIKRSSDPRAIKALGRRLRLAQVSRDIAAVEQLIRNYEEQMQTPVVGLEQLIEAGMIAEIPKDPYGHLYLFDPEARQITSKKGKRGLVFAGKTAATGLARFEKRSK